MSDGGYGCVFFPGARLWESTNIVLANLRESSSLSLLPALAGSVTNEES